MSIRRTMKIGKKTFIAKRVHNFSIFKSFFHIKQQVHYLWHAQTTCTCSSAFQCSALYIWLI